MRKLVYVLTIVLCLTGFLQGSVEVSSKVRRIAELLPHIKNPPSIDPYLPDNFVLMLQSDDSTKECIWGPKKINAINENEVTDELDSITEPYIRVLTQKGTTSFKNDMEAVVLAMKNCFPRQFKATFSKIGPYPLVVIEFMPTCDKTYFAYLGLNDEAGTVLHFILAYPLKMDYGNGNRPSKKDLTFWKNFLEKTKSFN